jgi:MFS family permease
VAAAGSLAAGALGAAPHVLHHAGPFAGAALLGGAAGSLLFGALGFALALPLLVRLRRRSGSWRLPVALLGLFAAVFALATLVVQPALSDDDSPASQRTPGAPGHEQHHP